MDRIQQVATTDLNWSMCMRSVGSVRWLMLAAIGVFLAGCGAKPRLAPMPREMAGVDATKVRAFDFNGDGRYEYREILDASGVVRYQEFDRDGDGTFEDVVDRATLDPNKTQHVFLLLDGVPYSLIDEMWREGHFRLFSRPGQMVSTFPSLTDPAYYRVFHCGVPYGYEAEFYDRSKGHKIGGTSFYLSGKNEGWVCGTDHRINFIEDAVMYLWPAGVFKREMASCQKIYQKKRGDDRIVLYFLSTDGICHMFPWDKAKAQLAMFDRWIEQMAYEAHGRIHFTMFADHGNNFAGCRYLDLGKILAKSGLHVGDKLRRSGDVVAPRFGLINFGSVFCYSRQEQTKAMDVLKQQEGVDAVACRADGGVRVANRDGTALIRHEQVGQESFYTYEPIEGDPLGLASVLADLRAKGCVRDDGFISDDDWFKATEAGPQPYAVPRLYGAMYVDVINTADIVVSLADGYYYGDPAMDKWVKLGGTHGGLSRASTVSFLMSTAFVAPAYVRPAEILPVINQYVIWTPHIQKVDYAWLNSDRALQHAPAAQRAGSPMWPAARQAADNGGTDSHQSIATSQ